MDSIVIIGTTSISLTLSITSIGLNILQISDGNAGNACTLSIGNKVLQQLFIKKTINTKDRKKRSTNKKIFDKDI